MLNVATIGMGNIGTTHARVYQASERAQLVAVCDMDESIADAAAERFGVPAYYSVAELIDRVELDAVSVTTAGPENGGHHYEPVMQSFDAGLHVLCEKPISNNIEHARAMAAKADEAGLYFGINLNHRFVPPAAKAKQWVEEGKLGDLLLMNMTMWIGNPNDTSPWFHIRALHPHSLDIMRYFCGDVKRVHAFFNQAPGRVCFSNAQVNLEFANGVVGHLTGSYDTNPRHNLERCEVMGTAGRFVLDNLYQELTLYPRQSDELTVVRNSIMGGLSGFDATFTNRINRWIEQVDDGAPREDIEASGREGLAVQEIIEAAIRSHHSGQAEEVPA
ncbi:MAG: Gfo/Idh/MocA family oxidoreductase [Caldilineaceae bacterium]|nr:Gfo/Idh/MocA family oxidoreductase [Caldilineaceae bacterium]MDE0336828.1 Gfo/Idh/MocA family oxidoreductase [Caldilineaceae bacterium]